MNFEYIASKDNKLVKQIRKLITSAKFRHESALFVLEGLRLCADAALNGYEIDTLVISESFENIEKIEVIYNNAKKHVKMPETLFNSLCDTVSPQGILCVVTQPQIIKDVCNINSGRYIVLENTADPANLGTIARTAEALGISGLIVSSTGCDPFSPKSQRATMGALLRLPLYISENIADTIKTLQLKGIKCFASVVTDADCDVLEAKFTQNCAVIIGNEANGLTKETIRLCDKSITISMSGRAESLNAASAASIFMWEMMKAGD